MGKRFKKSNNAFSPIYPYRTEGNRKFQRLKRKGVPYMEAMNALSPEEREEAKAAFRYNQYKIRMRKNGESKGL